MINLSTETVVSFAEAGDQVPLHALDGDCSREVAR